MRLRGRLLAQVPAVRSSTWNHRKRPVTTGYYHLYYRLSQRDHFRGWLCGRWWWDGAGIVKVEQTRRQRRSIAEKRKIVEQAMQPGASVARVAREHGVNANMVEHIRSLLQRKTNGFVVLALDCMLVETMQQFRFGTRATPGTKGKKYYAWFLTETAFANHFNANQAELFCKTIRCGLLHQAEAGRNVTNKKRPELSVRRIHRGSDFGLACDEYP
jgi:hypothetical protein